MVQKTGKLCLANLAESEPVDDMIFFCCWYILSMDWSKYRKPIAITFKY